MKRFLQLLAVSSVFIYAPLAQSLALGAGELRASKALGCVLAEDALGYLTEEQFNERFDLVVEGFSEPKVDVIYAQALGYIDGLLFGVPAEDPTQAMSRLESLTTSQACSRAVKLGVSL